MSGKKLRILFVIPIMGGGGAEIMLGAIMEQLHKLGHEVLLVTLYNHHETFKNFPNKAYIESTIQVITCSTRVVLSWRRKPRLTDAHFQQIVNDFDPHVIHSHLFEAEMISRSFIKKGVAYFSHGHDNMWQFTRFRHMRTINKRAFTNLIERRWLMGQYKRSNTTFIAISKDVESFFRKNLTNNLHKNIVLLHNGVDTARFKNDLDRKIEIGEKIKMVSVGNLVAKKNHTFLIDIGAELKKRSCDFSIDILGYGSLLEDLKRYATEKNISEHVVFRGNVKNVEDYLKKANLYIHPATYEPLGLVIIEAMASGLPVICLDGKGNRDLMIHGKNGYIFKEIRADVFVDQILELFNDPVTYKRISKFAKAYAEEFDIKTYCEKLNYLYQEKTVELAKNIID